VTGKVKNNKISPRKKHIRSDKMISLTIDNKEVQVPEGTTILEATRKIGIQIPTLCALTELNHTPGACRVCVVEVDRSRTLVASCALGGSAPNSVLSTIKYFREEYEAHIKDHKCPAGVCKALITFSIDEEKCKGGGLCARNCPQEAITGEKKKPHHIDQEKCIQCGICRDNCKFDAVIV
jgi:predicted molibdopterin-dependent oxidoreductase YjgC